MIKEARADMTLAIISIFLAPILAAIPFLATIVVIMMFLAVLFLALLDRVTVILRQDMNTRRHRRPVKRLIKPLAQRITDI